MNKNLLIAFGITTLFLGLAIQPSLATVQPEKIDVEPDVEGLVAQIKIVINEKLEKYESIPKVGGFWDIFWDTVDYLLDLLEKIGLKIVVFILLLLFNILFL